MAQSNITDFGNVEVAYPSFDENLSDAVCKYPVLYNKSDPGVYNRHKKSNAWNSVTIELNIEGYPHLKQQIAHIPMLLSP